MCKKNIADVLDNISSIGFRPEFSDNFVA